MNQLIRAALAAGALCAGHQAAAFPLQFTLNGPSSYGWVLDSAPTPSSYSGGSSTFSNLAISKPSGSASGNVTFWGANDGGGLVLSSGASYLNLYGPQLFGGSTNSPTFSAGSYTLDDQNSDATYLLSVTALSRPLYFNITQGDASYRFSINSTPTPNAYSNSSATFSGLTIDKPGGSATGNVIFWGANDGGGLVLSSGSTYLNLYGPQLFTGPVNAPMFDVGSYALNNANGSGAFALTVSDQPFNAAVPEPAAWALMIAGFGLVGTAQRRRRASAAPRPAALPFARAA